LLCYNINSKSQGVGNMKCLSCGNQIKDHEMTCTKCGAANLTYKIKERKKMNAGKKKAPKPRYGLIGFIRMYLHTFDFDGAVSRSEYWNNTIIIYILITPAIFLLFKHGNAYRFLADSRIVLYMNITFIGIALSIVTFTSHTIRRLHDAGYPGDYLRLSHIPRGSWIILKILLSPYRSNCHSDQVTHENYQMKQRLTISEMLRGFRDY
jgi:uncharacterized membrane protein YhaH (DUF805 family)